MTGASCSRHDPSSGQTSPVTSPADADFEFTRATERHLLSSNVTLNPNHAGHGAVHRHRIQPPSRPPRSVGLRPRTVYGMLHTVNVFITMVVVMLTLAGVGEDGSCQAKGNAGGSTEERPVEPARHQRPGARGPVVGGPARPRHLLARPGAPGRSSIRGRAPGVERLPVRQLGTPAGGGRGSLTLERPTGLPGPVLRPLQRHPRTGLTTSNFSGVPGSTDHSWVWFRPLSREGDVQGDVGLSCCVRKSNTDVVACTARSAAGTAS